MKTWFALFALLLAPMHVAAQDAREEWALSRYLLPFSWGEYQGAFGSLWETRTWVYNRGTADAHVSPVACVGPILCTGGLGLATHDPPMPLHAGIFTNAGVLLHVESLPGGDLVFHSRVRDLSRASDSEGTEVPVVHERAFASAPIVLLHVPVSYASRATLRIYALPEAPAPREVEVRFYRLSPGGTDIAKILLRADRLVLQQPSLEFVPPHYLPAHAQIDRIELLPELFFEVSTWIEVVPMTPGLRIWGFVSLTNNVTQQVTLVTPPVK